MGQSKAEKVWKRDVASLGCVACRNTMRGESPAELHHIRTGVGKAQRASDFQVIPLCVAHHRTGGHGVAFHAGPKTWQEQYGTELELLEQTKRDVEQLRKLIVGRAA